MGLLDGTPGSLLTMMFGQNASNALLSFVQLDQRQSMDELTRGHVMDQLVVHM